MSETILIFTTCVIALCMALSFVTGFKKKTLKNIKLPVGETWIPKSANIAAPVFFTAISGICEKKETRLSDVTWTCEGYKCEAGDYVFTAVAPKGFKFDSDPEILVHVTDKELFTVGDLAMSAENCLVKKGKGPKEFGIYDCTGMNQIYPDIRTTKRFVAGANVGFESGYVYSCHISRSTDVAGGTFGYLRVENNASVRILDATEVHTLVAVDGTADLTAHKGTVGAVIAEGDSIFKIVAANAGQLTVFDLPLGKFRLTIGGKEYKTVIKEFKGEDSCVVVAPGTALKDIKLPPKLKADTLDGVSEVAVDWKCENYDGEKNAYFFRPDALSYCMADNAQYPVVTVICADSASVDAQLMLPAERTALPLGIVADSLSVLTKLKADCIYGDRHFCVVLDGLKWYSDNYDPEAEGTYQFKLDSKSVNSAFNIGEVQLEVAVTDGKAEIVGNDLSVRSLDVLVSADTDRRIRVTDIAGIYTYSSELDFIDDIALTGKDSVLKVDGPYAQIKGEINVSDIDGTVCLDVFPSYVGKIRYADKIAPNVIINGVCTADYLEIKPTIIKNKFFANGIPVVISMDDDGEVYAYRASNMEKLSGNLSYGCVFGGSYKDGVENTNVTLKSGAVFELVGGGEKGNVYGEAVTVVDGGVVGNNWYGGCVSADYCEKVIAVFNEGAIKRDWYGAGADGGVGIAGKSYADDEYSVNLYMFGGSITNWYFGAKSNCGKPIYGNVRIEMFDGVALYLHCASTDDEIKGNVSAVVYGGTVEKQFLQKANVKGTTTVKVFKNGRINGDEEHKFPFFVGCDYNRFFRSFFDTDYKHVYRKYDRDKAVPLSKEGDDGKLVIRFLEIKQPWQNKENVRIANYTGDCMYITLPNGQNMVIDCPLESVWDTVEGDLRALGVDKIDYFVLTHYHGDHFGCLRKLIEAHEIGKYYLPDEKCSSAAVEGALPADADVTRINMYDSIEIGEGDKRVKITFLNPPRYAKRAMSPANHNPFSLCSVFEYGTSKMMLDADTYDKNERAWMYECPELISNVDLIKPGHHGITTSSQYDFLRMVNPEYVCISNLREYGSHGGTTIYTLENVNKYPHDRIKTTGMHGMIKATMGGTHGDIKVVTEYTEK